jgi:deazaflavin-dependent oxidoreductase (nitroreductase family)
MDCGDMSDDNLRRRLQAIAKRSTFVLVHRGRKSGKPYEVTIWFVVEGDTVYLETANTNRQWVRNVKVNPDVVMKLKGEEFKGRAEFLTDESQIKHVDDLFANKYLIVRILTLIAWPLFSLLNRGRFRVTLD